MVDNSNVLLSAVRAQLTWKLPIFCVEQVVQLLKALVVPSQKVLASDARVEDGGQDNPVLIIDRSAAQSNSLSLADWRFNSLDCRGSNRNIEEAEKELQEALEMLRVNNDAGLISTMPPKITARLETERAYCSNLVKNLAICQDFATAHEWDRLAIHCDDLLNSPECRTCTTQSVSPSTPMYFAARKNVIFIILSVQSFARTTFILWSVRCCVICVDRQLPGAEGRHG